MKRSRIGMMAAVAAMAVTMAWGVTALAGGKAPEPGSWEYQMALEAGSLPADYFDVEGKTPRDPAGKATEDMASKPTLVEYGGTVYRLGIDTP